MDENQFLEHLNKDFPELQITKTQLASPTPSMITRYYSALLANIVRIPVDELVRVSEEQFEILQSRVEGPTLLNHISNYNLYAVVKFIFDKIGFPCEFLFSDIMFPSPKRSLVFMKYMYIFFSHCCDFDSYFEDYLAKNDNSTLIDKLNEEKFALKRQIAENEENKIGFVEKTKQIKKQLAEYACQKEEIENVLKNLRLQEENEMSKMKVLEEQERKKQEEFNKIDEERKYLESLIVSDEKQYLENYRKLQAKKDECYKKLQELEQSVRQSQAKVNQFEKVLDLQTNLEQTLKSDINFEGKPYNIKGLYDLSLALRRECEAFSKEEAELNQKLKEKEIVSQNLMKELAELKGEYDRTSCKWSEMIGRLKKMITDCQRALAALTTRYEIEGATIEATTAQLNEVKVCCENKTAELLSHHRHVEESFSEKEDAILKYLTDLQSKAENHL